MLLPITKNSVYLLATICLINPALAAAPRYQVTDRGLILEGVSLQCPMIYDNDWWTDVPDAAYIWAKASLGKCKLRGNIITRCTFAWEKSYVHKMEEQIQDCQKLLQTAWASELRNIPAPFLGAEEALRRPASGKIERDEPAGYEMLVASFRTGDTEIFIVNPSTGDARNLTRSPKSRERYPSWSPDGKWVAFNSDRDGTHNLYIIRADGTNLRQLTREKRGVEAGMQSWTADGKWIYFGLFGKGEPRMCRIAPDGTNFKEVGKGIDPAVSPDGKSIAFARNLADGHHLFIMQADGSNVRRLTSRGNPFGGVHATWTPDGKSILYADRVGDALEIFRIDPDGKNAKQLTRLGKACTTPAVSPDGKWISFRYCDEVYWRDGKTSERTYRERRADKRPVWIMGMDGSDPHVIEPLHYQTTIDGSPAPWRPR